MGAPIFRKLEPRRPFKAVGEALGSGLSQGIGEGRDDSAIQRALDAAKTSQEDPFEAILRSGASPERQQLAIKGVQGQQQQQLKRQQEQFKTQEQQAAIEGTKNFISRNSGGKIKAEDLEGVPQATLNAIANNLTKQRDVLSPLEKGFDKIQEGILSKVPTLEQNIADANRSLELSQTGNVGVDFEGGNLTDKFRGALRLIGIDAGQTADEATLSNLVLRRADELKRKFGSRITNFDFEQWLKGQPAQNKFRNANIALAMMQKKEAEVDRAKFEAWQQIVSDPSITPDQQLNAMLMAEREILQSADEELSQQLNSLSNFERIEPENETLQQIRDRVNSSPKVDSIIEGINTPKAIQSTRARIQAIRRKRANG